MSSSAVHFLTSAPRAFEVTRVFSEPDFWSGIGRGFMMIRLTQTRGGTELRLRLDAATRERATRRAGATGGPFVCAGSCVLDGARLQFEGEVNVGTLQGVGRLQLAAESP